MNRAELQKFTSWLGKRSYAVRVKRLGITRIREIARENGKKGGRPPKKGRVRNDLPTDSMRASRLVQQERSERNV